MSMGCVFVFYADTVSNILDIFLKKTGAITQIIDVLPETLNTIQKLADSTSNDQTVYKHRKYQIGYTSKLIICLYERIYIFSIRNK